MSEISKLENLQRRIESWRRKRISFSEYDRIVLEGKKSSEISEILPVSEIVRREADKWLKRKRFSGCAPLIIVDTIFSLQRRYLPMVENILRPFYQEFPEKKLNMLAKCDPSKLCKTFTPKLSSNRDHPLSNPNRWRNVVKIAQRFVENYGSDIDAIHDWAKDVDIASYQSDPIKQGLRGIGISAIQYLRMQAGIDTVKPDIRVKEGLRDLSILYHDDIEAVRRCEDLARELNMRPMEFDFILWYSRSM